MAQYSIPAADGLILSKTAADRLIAGRDGALTLAYLCLLRAGAGYGPEALAAELKRQAEEASKDTETKSQQTEEESQESDGHRPSLDDLDKLNEKLKEKLEQLEKDNPSTIVGKLEKLMEDDEFINASAGFVLGAATIGLGALAFSALKK